MEAAANPMGVSWLTEDLGDKRGLVWLLYQGRMTGVGMFISGAGLASWVGDRWSGDRTLAGR